MKKILALALCLTALVLAPGISSADGLSDILTDMKTARTKLIALIETDNKEAQPALVKEIHDATDSADKKMDAQIADAATPADVKTKLTEAKTIWEDFKKTRETEIIPAILAGKVSEARVLAVGIQKERFQKITNLLQ